MNDLIKFILLRVGKLIFDASILMRYIGNMLMFSYLYKILSKGFSIKWEGWAIFLNPKSLFSSYTHKSMKSYLQGN